LKQFPSQTHSLSRSSIPRGGGEKRKAEGELPRPTQSYSSREKEKGGEEEEGQLKFVPPPENTGEEKREKKKKRGKDGTSPRCLLKSEPPIKVGKEGGEGGGDGPAFAHCNFLSNLCERKEEKEEEDGAGSFVLSLSAALGKRKKREKIFSGTLIPLLSMPAMKKEKRGEEKEKEGAKLCCSFRLQTP